jgi:hypothetical protein
MVSELLNGPVDDQRTYRWVAGPDSAKAAARSFARGNVRRRRWAIALLWLGAGLVMWSALGDDLDPVARILWGLAYGTVLSACAFGIGTRIGRLLNRRRFAQRLAPGTEITSRFGDTSVELAGPLSRHELAYDGVVHVERIDGWVHLRQLGSPVSVVWPGDLFPDEEIERMRSHVAARDR